MAPLRRELRVSGLVQGVGLRPWAVRRARSLGLTGRVRNTPLGVEIAIEGSADALDRFTAALRDEPPAAARIEAVEALDTPSRGARDFRIAASGRGTRPPHARVPPDLAICAACLDDLFDPRDRRHRYAFTHCAACGPRASLLLGLPWDRGRTAMRGFPLCAACAAEHADPECRRHHAETIACPRCGPRLRAFVPGEPEACADDPVERAADALAAGRIVALLGTGGFHLLVDARNPDAVARLRERKRRPAKPFAVLVPDLATARRLCTLSPDDERRLAGPERPIVLAPRATHSGVAESVAPRGPDLGLLLPFAPPHWLLLFGPGTHPARDAARFDALVLTSANRSGEPTWHRAEPARELLRGVADLVIEHDRPITRPNDDPVFRTSAIGAIPVRLSRATAPLVLRLPAPVRAPAPIVAVGGDLACAPAIAIGGEILLAEHVGDLANADAADALVARVSDLCRMLRVTPAAAAHDAHPGYAGTELAHRFATHRSAVQHHHAHAAACLVDNATAGPALAVALDGLGHGDDGMPWGGELLLADLWTSRRLAHLEAVPLPGGDAAAREPWRMAAVWLARAFPDGAPLLPWHARRDPGRLRAVLAIAARGVASPPTTSCGRLFDAIASLLDWVDVATYEAEAPLALEAAAANAEAAPLRARATALGGPGEIELASLVRGIAEAHAAGVPRAALAAAFHDGLADRVAAAAIAWSRRLAIGRVALTGGCFQNRRLLETVHARLTSAGLLVLTHRRVPPGDGGLAVGQAAVAAARAAVR